MNILSWIFRIIIAIILLQTLYFKFTGAEESKYIFTALMGENEAVGRIGSGIVELIASILLLIPATAWLGALLALGTVTGAIFGHLTKLGIVVKDDGGLLFGLAILIFILSLTILIYSAQGNSVDRKNGLIFCLMNYITETFKKRRWQIAVGFCFLFFGVFVNWQTVLSAGNFEIANIFDLQKVNTAEFSVAALFFILAFSTLISEDLTCIGAGLLASQGKISLSLAVLGCAFGIYVGDILLYWAGRLLGRSALKIKPFSWILNEKTLEKSSAWLDKNGGQAVFLSRFTSGLRLPLYFAAGMLRTNFWRFSIYFLIAVAVWTPVLVGVSYWLGESVLENGLFGKFNSLILLLLVLGLFVLIRTVPQLFSWKKRRILWGKIKRRFIWEFWSIRVFYFPVVIYVFWLGIKNGGLNVFTCANPAIPAGGFVGESKKEILDGLKNSTSAAPYLLTVCFYFKKS